MERDRRGSYNARNLRLLHLLVRVHHPRLNNIHLLSENYKDNQNQGQDSCKQQPQREPDKTGERQEADVDGGRHGDYQQNYLKFLFYIILNL